MQSPTKKLFYLLLALFSILILGTFGFIVADKIENPKSDVWNLLDSFYVTVIALTTIGYGEVHKLGTYGKVFTIILIFFGVGTTYYRHNSSNDFGGSIKAIFWEKENAKGNY